jgi:hypothetical protein
VIQQLRIVLCLERADSAICHLRLSSIITLVEGLRFCLASTEVAPRRMSRTLLCRLSCWDISRGATFADSFLLVCLRIQFQENEINPNLIYQFIHVSSDCGSRSSTFSEKVLVYFDVYGVNNWRFVHR